jgi:hypothetical protein
MTDQNKAAKASGFSDFGILVYRYMAGLFERGNRLVTHSSLARQNNTNIKKLRPISIPLVGFELTIPTLRR